MLQESCLLFFMDKSRHVLLSKNIHSIVMPTVANQMFFRSNPKRQKTTTSHSWKNTFFDCSQEPWADTPMSTTNALAVTQSRCPSFIVQKILKKASTNERGWNGSQKQEVRYLLQLAFCRAFSS